MTRPPRQAVTQQCPNCGVVHDVNVYVSGQELTCSCGIRFEVKRSDVRPSMIGPAAPASKQSTLNERKGPAPAPAQAIATPAEAAPPPAASSLGRTLASRPKGDDVTRVAPPLEVPGYELVELLGRGGMGEVWRARQLSLGRMVAVKLLPEKLTFDAEFVARFDKEATALASLSHPNIVQIFDRGRAGERYFFAMELVTGTNLRELMGGKRLAPLEAMRVAVQVAWAIDCAHEQKIVHRDLKPENILVDARGHVKVLDFGLAGMNGSDRNISLTATAVAMGTVNYMAPEQRRDAKHVDHRADLYSLGVLLYEMLTGELPLGRFKMPSEKLAGVSAQLDEIVGKLLETDPEHRPARAQDVARALEGLAGSGVGLSVAAAPGVASAPPGLSVIAPAQGGWRTVAGLLLGMLVVGAVLKVWPAGGPPPPPAHAPGWYADTEDELFSSRSTLAGEVKLDFEAVPDGGEELNVHSGQWALERGALTAVQFGDPTDTEEHSNVVMPRAYLAHRYFTSDDFEAEVELQVDELGQDFPPLAKEAQRYGELGFRIKDLQVSVFAIPQTGMRLMWRYYTPEGTEVVGNSARELEQLVQDETPVPKGPFRVRLRLLKQKNNGTNVEAWVNGQRFYRKVLDGLGGQTGKVAMGCRNLSCRFDDLKVRGQAMARPKLKGLGSDVQ